MCRYSLLCHLLPAHGGELKVLGLGPFGAVLGASLLAAGYAGSIQRAADHVIANTGQIFHTAAADEHDAVLLQVVADARNISSDLDAIGQADASDLAQR